MAVPRKHFRGSGDESRPPFHLRNSGVGRREKFPGPLLARPGGEKRAHFGAAYVIIYKRETGLCFRRGR